MCCSAAPIEIDFDFFYLYMEEFPSAAEFASQGHSEESYVWHLLKFAEQLARDLYQDSEDLPNSFEDFMDAPSPDRRVELQGTLDRASSLLQRMQQAIFEANERIHRSEQRAQDLLDWKKKAEERKAISKVALRGENEPRPSLFREENRERAGKKRRAIVPFRGNGNYLSDIGNVVSKAAPFAALAGLL